MTPHCFLNGAFIPLQEAKVSVTDIGLLRGFGVYEGLITHNRKPFRLDDHIERLQRSAEKMSLKVPYSAAELGDAVRKLVDMNVMPGKEALVRIILTGGPAVGVIEYNYDTPTLFMLADEFVPLEREYVEKGCSVTPIEYHRDLADIKSINYIKTVLLQKERKARGALELVFTWQGKVYEGGGSNFFIVKNGALITPKDDIVFGITRKVLLELARPHFPVEERDVSVEEMYGADEALITGSFKEVVPVVRIGEQTVGDGAVGPVSRRLVELFESYARSY